MMSARRAPEPFHADAYAPLYPADKRSSKKFETYVHMVAICTIWYNFIRIHKTPKKAACDGGGCFQKALVLDDLCGMMDAAAPKPRLRGPYRKRMNDFHAK